MSVFIELITSMLKKIFTPTGIFLLPFIIIIVFILSASKTSLLTKMGFETKESIKMELAQTQKELDRANQEVARLKVLVNINKEAEHIKEMILDSFAVKNIEVDDIINNIINLPISKDKNPINIIDANLQEKEGYDEIVSIHKTYNALFEV